MGKLKWHIILVLVLWLAFSGVAAAEQLYVNESGWWRAGGALDEGDYVGASDGKFTTKLDNILPSVSESSTITDLILTGNESYVIKDQVYEVKNVTIKDNAILTVKNATLRSIASSDFQYNVTVEDNGSLILDNGKISTNLTLILTPWYCIHYSLYSNDVKGEVVNKTINGNVGGSELVNASGGYGGYANYTVYIKGESFSASTKEPSILSKAAIEPEINSNQALQEYTGINVSNLTNMTINVTTTVTYFGISRPYKIKLNLYDNATFATKNDSEAAIYEINSTGQPEINISESDFEYLTAIEGGADVIITKSYVGDLEKLSTNSVSIFDSEIYNYGELGEDVAISIDSAEDVFISNTILVLEGGDGYDGYDGGQSEEGGDGGDGGESSILVVSDMNISIINSSLSSVGGNAGDGGDGGNGVGSWDAWGGDAGNGGDGGNSSTSISAAGKSIFIINSSTSNVGGAAGDGGDGGNGDWWDWSGSGGDGGDGGDGGYASVSITNDEISIKNYNLSSMGGNKGSKGYGGWGQGGSGSDGDDGYLGNSSIPFTGETLTILDSDLQSTDYNGNSAISFMTFDCYTDLANATYTPFSVTSGNIVNICYWLTTSVTDEIGTPIDNAQVKVTENSSGVEVKTDYTDENGISTMYLPSCNTTTDSNHMVFVGNYSVQAFKDGYKSDKEFISLRDNMQISFTTIVTEEILDEGNTTIPYAVYLILHDPSGDGSYSYMEKAVKSTIGSEFDLRASESITTEVYAGLLSNGIGYSRSVNMNTTESGGVEISIETADRIETPKTEEPGAMGPGYGDVFFGEEWLVHYQFINRTTWINNGTGYQLNSSENVYRYGIIRSSEFVKTGAWISENVEEPWRSRVLDLDMGFDNCIDGDEVGRTEHERTLSFTGGPSTGHTRTTTLTNSSELTFTMEVNETVAVNFGLHEWGLPVGGKVTVAASLYMGQTTSSSQEHTVESGYVLEDNDIEPITDYITTDIYYDMVYGTYLFTTDSDNSYTSEPREHWTNSPVSVTPTSGTEGTQFTIFARIGTTTHEKIEATIQHPDETTIYDLELFDDGLHSDGAAGDRNYGNTWDSTGADEGRYYVDIVSWDTHYNRQEAENLATFTLGTDTVRGDLNDDDQITAADAVIALQMAVSGEYSDDADMNGDGAVSSVDALMILQTVGE